MEPLGTEWVAEMKEQIRDHIEYYPLDRRMEELEPLVGRVLREMEPEQRKVITEYIRILRKMEVCLSLQSYLAGIRSAHRDPKGTEKYIKR